MFIVLACHKQQAAPTTSPDGARARIARGDAPALFAIGGHSARPLDSGRGRLRWSSGEVPSPLVGPRSPGGQAGHSLVLVTCVFPRARVRFTAGGGLAPVPLCAGPLLARRQQHEHNTKEYCPFSPVLLHSAPLTPHTTNTLYPTHPPRHGPHRAGAFSFSVSRPSGVLIACPNTCQAPSPLRLRPARIATSVTSHAADYGPPCVAPVVSPAPAAALR